MALPNRDTRGWPFVESLAHDLRYAFRTLRREPGFTFVAVLILALGIGANVVVFGVVNTILLRPLPFYEPQQLVWISQPGNNTGISGDTFSVDTYEDLRAQNHSYQDVTGYYAFSVPDNLKLTGSGDPLPVTGIAVAPDFFGVLGVAPGLGRVFTVEEERTGDSAVLLSNSFWKRQFGGDRDIVGKAITLSGERLTVVGVLPQSFDFGAVFSPGARVDVYTPQNLNGIRNDGSALAVIGRLKHGVSVAQAQAEAKILFQKFYWGKRYPESIGFYKAKLIPLKEFVTGKLRRSLEVLWAAVGLILLIVCVNLSNIQLVRATTRRKEFALRAALGAGRGRLLRQMLTEGIVLSGAGALLGLGFAYATTFYLAHQSSIALPLLSSVRVDGDALAWTVLIAVAVGLVSDIAPGLKHSSGNLRESLKDSELGTGDGRRSEGMRAVLVVSEVALACVLTVGAGLLLRSFLHVIEIDLGFQPSHAGAIKMEYPVNVNNDDPAAPDKRSAVLQDVLQRVLAIPGIEAAGITDNLPLERNRNWAGPGAKGRTYRKGEIPYTFVYVVSPGYLKAMGMRLRGRDFGWQDSSKSEHVMILNETAARYLWPSEDAVGKMAVLGKTDLRVIGVIADVHERAVEGKAGWQMYLPIMQGIGGSAEAQLVLRSKLPVDVLAPSVMSALRSINPVQPAEQLRPVQSIVDRAISPRRFFAVLVALFAALGLILASLGIYGVISYSVTRQTKEIGIRMALGATRERVQIDVISKTLRMALIGIAVGTAASFAVARVISSLLFGTQPTDPITFAGMILLLTAVSFAAGYLPARRASRIDPMVALRSN